MMTKHRIWGLLVGLFLGAGIQLSFGQGPLTPLPQLLVRTDSNGYLMVTNGAAGAQGPLTPMANLRGRTDSNGFLMTTCNNCGGGGGLASTDIDTCAELATIQTNETGTCGALVMSDSPTFTDDLTLGAAGALITGSAGTVTFLGLGPGADESLKLDLDGTSNVGVFTTTTGITRLSFTGMDLEAPNLLFSNAAGDGFYYDTFAGDPRMAASLGGSAGAGVMAWHFNPGSGNTWAMLGVSLLNWASGNLNGTPDVGLGRSAAGVLEVNNGNALGNYRDLRLRALIFTPMQSVTVDAATTFAATSSYIDLQCTGAETINTITGGTVGQELYLQNTDTECTIADDDAVTAANAINLTGAAANDVGAAEKMIHLIYVTGGFWWQIGESDN